MRDSMRRYSAEARKHNGKVNRPSVYVDEQGVEHAVPEYGLPVGQLAPRHKGVWGEVNTLCRCPECSAADFGPERQAERVDAAQAKFEAEQASILARHSAKASRKRAVSKAVGKVTILRRKA